MTKIIVIFNDFDAVSISWAIDISGAGYKISQALNESRENNSEFIFLIDAKEERVHFIKTDTIRRIQIEKEKE